MFFIMEEEKSYNWDRKDYIVFQKRPLISLIATFSLPLIRHKSAIGPMWLSSEDRIAVLF